MSQGRGRSRVGPPIVRWAIALATGAGLAALVMIAGMFDMRRLGEFPGDPSRVLLFCCGAPGSAPVPAQTVLAGAPLAGFPFAEKGQAAAEAGDTARARPLMLEAARRDPLLPGPHSWLASQAILDRDFDRAVHELSWLYALTPARRPEIAKVLAGLAAVPSASGAVERAIAKSPIWVQAVVGELITSKADPSVIFRMIGAASGTPAGESVNTDMLVQALVQRREFELAYLAWINGLPESAMGSVGFVYDREFRNLPGARPFNWNLVQAGGANADFMDGGGLRASYFSNAPADLADQLLLLPPGRYRLDTLAANTGGTDGNQAQWTLVCVGSGQMLGVLRIPLARLPKPARIDFEVPDNCQAQKLLLGGVPTEYSRGTEIEVRSVSVAREGAGS